MAKSEVVPQWDHLSSNPNSKLCLAQGSVFETIEDDGHMNGPKAEKPPEIPTTVSSRPSTLEISVRRVTPRSSGFAKLCEKSRLVSTRIRLEFLDNQDSEKPLSKPGQFVHTVVEPLFTWYGKNLRVLSGPCLPRIKMQDKEGTIVNASSHDYIGYYKPEPEAKLLQHLCLERLPVAGSLPLLEDATHEAIAKFFMADFCYTTSTGYGSNYSALPAIINDHCAVIVDDKCHKSLFTGIYLSESPCVRKFSHNNAEDLETILTEVKGRFQDLVVIVEGLYSMDGDGPPLGSLNQLKERFGFILLCDEAHSFLSIGHTGRGCLEQWNDEHPDNLLPWDLIDVRTAALSKAVGGFGGMICGKSRFKLAVEKRFKDLHMQGNESLPCYTMVQTLWVLGQPSTTHSRLHRLAEISRFCHSELNRFGIHVYGTPGMPVLPIHAGRPSTACKLSYAFRKLGLLAAPVSAPAVDLWESRVRVNLSAGHTNEDVDRILDAIIYAAQSIGISHKTKISRRRYTSVEARSRSASEETEATETFEKIQGLIHCAAESWDTNTTVAQDHHIHDAAVIDAGHASQKAYGLSSGSARWVCGTFTNHLSVESLIAKATGAEASLTYADSSIGLASTIAALSRPLIGYGKHYMLVGFDVPECTKEGLRISPKKGRPTVLRYRNSRHLLELAEDCSRRKESHQIHLTIYVYIQDFDNSEQMLSPLLAALSAQRHAATGITLLIHSPSHILDPRRFGTWPASKRFQILIYGSFHQTFGLPGAYLTGGKKLIQELRFTSRGYMYTTSPPPWILGMVKVKLERLDGNESAGNQQDD